MKNKQGVYEVLIGAFILLLPAFRNGFPFTYLDTHAYIYSGMAISVPFDRPIFYGIWLLLSSLGLSLWIPIILQTIITAYLLRRLFVVCLNNEYANWQYICLCAIVSIFTGAGINVASIMPDSFTPILVLSFLLFVYDTQHKGWYWSLVLAASVMHNSHWLLFFALLIAWFVLYKGDQKRIQLKWLVSILGISYLLLAGSNYAKFKQFTPSRGATFFLMGRLAETGILTRYLENNCDKVPPDFCARKGEMLMGASEFIWSGNSPLQANGGFMANEVLYEQVVSDILTNPKYLIHFLYRSVFDGFHQLVFNRIITSEASVSHDNFKQMERYFRDDASAAKQALQTYGVNDYPYTNLGYQLLLLTALIIILYSFLQQGSFSDIGLFILLAIAANAWITATFANVDSRLQYRLVWLIVPIALITYVQLKAKRKSKV